LNVVAVPTIDVDADVVAIPTDESPPGALPLLISSWVILYFKYT
jgi:hypothetical protein